MIYCREKLVDILLESPWITLEDRFDLEIVVKHSIKRGVFSHNDWESTAYFLETGSNYSEQVETVIKVLAHTLGYTDEKFLRDIPDKAEAYYQKLEKGVRL